jgi:UDP-N-acetylmuramoylalanine--D-glutamate ligase
MIPVQGYEGATGRCAGSGPFGPCDCAALVAGGAIRCHGMTAPKRARAAEAAGHTPYDLSRVDWSGVAALITSPGIPHLYPAPHKIIAAAMAAGVPVDNDIGLFFRSMATSIDDEFRPTPARCGGHGSNGKSTTTALIHHLLQVAGKPTQMAGNIGKGVLSIDPPVDGEVIVLELSSYQTELARALTPDIAVFTNLSPDHLDRHNGMGGYFAAKRRLFAEGGPDRAVIGVDEVEGQFMAGQ